jgi:hypothetical protein
MDLLVTLKNPLSTLGNRTLGFVTELGCVTVFFPKGFALIFFIPIQVSKIMQQVYYIF